jgi:hypothetical protein
MLNTPSNQRISWQDEVKKVVQAAPAVKPARILKIPQIALKNANILAKCH